MVLLCVCFGTYDCLFVSPCGLYMALGSLCGVVLCVALLFPRCLYRMGMSLFLRMCPTTTAPSYNTHTATHVVSVLPLFSTMLFIVACTVHSRCCSHFSSGGDVMILLPRACCECCLLSNNACLLCLGTVLS